MIIVVRSTYLWKEKEKTLGSDYTYEMKFIYTKMTPRLAHWPAPQKNMIKQKNLGIVNMIVKKIKIFHS